MAADFERFVREGGATLREHALFEALHARHSGNWSDWQEGWRHPGDTAIAAYLDSEAATVRYHLFLQWLTARSFAAAQTAARAAGMRIGLIGDLAIGMDRAGSHAWARQSDLLLGLSVGAPPDIFNPRGQDWGLTGFSPQALVARGFEPFLATLRAALRHAGGVRIDHIMGLMRLWLVPRGAPASEGAYLAYPVEDLLRLLALELHRHRAVVIGEDLGTVPPGFRARLRRAGIAGMDVLWFERTRAQLQEAVALAPRCRRHDDDARSADGGRLVERRGHPDAPRAGLRRGGRRGGAPARSHQVVARFHRRRRRPGRAAAGRAAGRRRRCRARPMSRSRRRR